MTINKKYTKLRQSLNNLQTKHDKVKIIYMKLKLIKMRKFIHTLILKIKNIKIERGYAPSETKW